MGMRSGYVFEYAPFLGRTDREPTRIHLFKHMDGNPGVIVPIVKRYWQNARKRVADNPLASEYTPELSLAQVIAGLLLADVPEAFMFIDELEDTDIEFIYSFRQFEMGDDTLELTIHAVDEDVDLFKGGYSDLLRYWKVDQDKFPRFRKLQKKDTKRRK